MYAIVAALMALGVAGAVLPVLPGVGLILAGAVLHAVATDFTPIGGGRLAILAALALAGLALPHVAAALGARGRGGSRWAVMGAVLGMLAGLPFAPLGLIVGPVAGAIAGELLRSGDVRASVRSGVGAAVGVLAGTLAHLAVALAMVGLFVWWLWAG